MGSFERRGISLNRILYPLSTIEKAHSSFVISRQFGAKGANRPPTLSEVEDRTMEVAHQNFF